ncbi:MAG: anaerobic ribonucleoside-triphosphate reductase activating protein [Firmicutes bacterium]|nr:anaerobic ribonucleoside-triphosphate reductase activating protein [Bacillota bacterium]
MKIRLAADLQTDSIVDGLGIRTVIWTQGCSHNCYKCHNPQTHDFNGGDLVDIEDVIEELENLSGQDGVTFSGGDPMFQARECSILAKKVQELGMNVWAYTGFTFEELLNKGNKDILDFLSNIDVLIDGKFELDKKSMDLEFRGSSNQRIIDVPKSLESHEVILYNLNKRMNKNKKKETLYI